MHLKVTVQDKENLGKLLDSLRAGHLEEALIPSAIKYLEAFRDLLGEVEEKSISIDRLRNLAFGPRTERFTGGATLFDDVIELAGEESSEPNEERASPKPKNAGHGRRKLQLFAHAEKVKCELGHLKIGEHCPECAKGTMYKHESQIKTCVRRGAFVIVQEFEIQKLRCGDCHHTEKAEEPQILKECVGRYHYSIIAALAVFRYHAGLPSYRMKSVTSYLGLEIADSTQFTLFEACADLIKPVYKELRLQAANGAVSYRDDTPNRILDLKRELKQKATGDPKIRTGITTTCIVVTTKDGHNISLFETNAKHAGEVFGKLMSLRKEPSSMLAMADAASQNRKHDANVVELGCWAHARRNFYELKERHPQDCESVLALIQQLYKERHDGQDCLQSLYEKCQQGMLSHGEHTSLHKAYRYVINHWDRLAAFLSYSNAPIDNNECERDLKRPIRHRKNSLFFKNTVGAEVGDILTSMIATAVRAGVNPVQYLEDIMKHAEHAKTHPHLWLPWSYEITKQAKLA